MGVERDLAIRRPWRSFNRAHFQTTCRRLRRALRADADGNLWIRTSTIVNGQPVYDIVNRRGQPTDRLQLPPYRTIAGFGPGEVYMVRSWIAPVVLLHLEVHGSHGAGSCS